LFDCIEQAWGLLDGLGRPTIRRETGMMERRMGTVVVVLLACMVGSSWAADTDAGKDAAREAALKRAADKKAARVEKLKEGKKLAAAWHDEVLEAYMKADWDTYDEIIPASPKHRRGMSSDHRKDIAYIRSATKKHRPSWWSKCRSGSNVSFPASIWGKKFTANYMPSDMLGVMAPVEIRRGKLMVLVSWKPNYVDSTKKYSDGSSIGLRVEGYEKHEFTMGHMAEAIIWHEMGHNYVSITLPLKHVLRMYVKHQLLYSHLQELFAEVTCLYHASPPARLFMLKMRQINLRDRYYDDSEAHDRSCSHAVGSLILAKVMMKKELWPSFHLPGKMPEEDIERSVIYYMYSKLPKQLTLKEDKMLREYMGKWARAHGSATLRSKGKAKLENRQTFSLMGTDDRSNQKKRDTWVKTKLAALIKAKQTDDPKEAEKAKKKKSIKTVIIRIEEKDVDEDKDKEEKEEKEEKKDKDEDDDEKLMTD
jgi:hypothetical protein